MEHAAANAFGSDAAAAVADGLAAWLPQNATQAPSAAGSVSAAAPADAGTAVSPKAHVQLGAEALQSGSSRA